MGKLLDKPKAGPHKYQAEPTVYNGVRYDSKKEATRAGELDLWASAKLGRFWVGHPKFRLGVSENVYVADFLVVDPGVEVLNAEDTRRGLDGTKFQPVREALWRQYGPCDLWILGSGKTEIITSRRAP